MRSVSIVFIHIPVIFFIMNFFPFSLPPSLPPSLPSSPLTQTADQEAYDFFTSTVEDHLWPSTRTATHEGEEEGVGEERRGGGGEGEGEEMDTSVLLEQQVQKIN